MRSALAAALLVFTSTASPVHAWEPVTRLNVESVGTSNVFGDDSREWDLIVHPTGELGLDFGDYWSTGYGGELNGFSQHRDLLSHWHELYLFANPAWGVDGENEYTFEARLQWLSNRAAYSAMDLLQPSLLNALVLEPAPWLRWRTELEGAYRNFYRDHDSRSVDAKANSALTFVLPSRTSLTARLDYALRFYPKPMESPVTGEPDRLDHQLQASLHLAQGLWRHAGLQLQVGYLPELSNNVLLERKMAQQVFFYYGEEFLYAGHRAKAVLKQKLGEALQFEASLHYERRDFPGWRLIDQTDGSWSDENRRDVRLTPRALLRYVYLPAGTGMLDEAGITLEYAYVRQRSNDSWFDTETHVAGLSGWSAW